MSKILLVEDDASFAESLQGYLDTRGHHVVVAKDDSEAFELATRLGFDVVISDYDLGPTSEHGLAILHRLYAEHGSPKTILFSGCYRDEEARTYGWEPDTMILKSDIRGLEAALA